jgi:hypothetical protein
MLLRPSPVVVLLGALSALSACGPADPPRGLAPAAQPDAGALALDAAQPSPDAGLGTPGPDAGTPLADAGATIGGLLDLADVSMLFPLRSPAALWALDSVVDGHRLLEAAWAEEALPVFEAGSGRVPARSALASEYRVVGVRFDPCFPGEGGACRRQVRLVAQPVEVGLEGTPQVVDAAAHLLYDLDEAAWSDVVVGLHRLHTLAGDRTRGQPLSVHPVLDAEGADGPYGQALAALVRRHARSEHLVQIAGMSTNGAVWIFRATNVVGGALVGHAIPRLPGAPGHIVSPRRHTPTLGGYHFDPELPAGDPLGPLAAGTEFLTTPADTLRAELEAIGRLLHPTATSPATHDCGSCHAADFMVREVLAARPDVTVTPAFVAPRFDLRRLDRNVHEVQSLRAFGWFGSEPAIAQRTIHESAAVAEALSGSDRRP